MNKTLDNSKVCVKNIT